MPSLTPPRPTFVPPNWPSEIHYLHSPFYHPLPPTLIQLIRSPRPPPPAKPNEKVEIRMITDPAHPACGQRGLFTKKQVKKGECLILYSGHVHLDPEEEERWRRVREGSDYDLTLVPRLDALLPFGKGEAPAPEWAEKGLCVDASQMGNESRMINDYRGVPVPPPLPAKSSKPSKPTQPVKSRPNVFFHSLRVPSSGVVPAVLDPEKSTPLERMRGEGELRMGVFTSRDLGRGEEVLISYGKSL